ncbi:HAMP domain-containing histidine kinase [Persicimonas caeni]|uniref:histidine kinase n=1 Tax=Persicimonas caeni TaxID=2292766 RepID=A0A4Y6PND1_PERCE|nr:ATP-binding protein [Persicimonas caeni]QDG49812.1 HAMP domain-containing histidine kinase [Persicimonas caeni]QED31033.1 HAMP domain-containing histidine kinase [Persicimonas caeni]
MQPQSQITARGLIRLRWFAIAGQILTIALSRLVLSLPVPLVELGGVIACEVGVNLLAIYLNGRKPEQSSLQLGLFLGIDLLILTALLYLTGGPLNPFNFLYVVHIALAAVTLEPKWTWSLGLLSMGLFGLLFVDHRPFPMASGPMTTGAMEHGHAHGTLNWHVKGMWFAFVVAAATITFFVGRLARELEARNKQLAAAREKSHRAEKLAALATLATGAAHELGTPLSTIAVVSKDLEYEAEQRGEESTLVEDARLIRAQVDRCRQIIDQLASDTGQTLGESARAVQLTEVVDEAIGEIDDVDRLTLDIPPRLAESVVYGPKRTLVHAVRALVKNALQASPCHTQVRLSVTTREESYCFEVIDHGPGIPAEHRARVTEPFFSTKETGEGMGLGLFLARSVADTLGGDLRFEDAPSGGTRAVLELPLEKVSRPQGARV